MQADKKSLRSIFLGVAGCILLFWFLFRTDQVKTYYSFVMTILSPFIVGAVLAFILNVPMRGIENLLKKVKPAWRRPIALTITILAVLLVLVLVFCLLIPAVVDACGKFINSLLDSEDGFFIRVKDYILAFLNTQPELKASIKEWLSSGESLKSLDVSGIVAQTFTSLGAIWNFAVSAIGTVTGALINAVVSIVFAVYCLLQKETLARQGRKLVYAFLPEKWGDLIIRILRLTNSMFSNFLSGQCLEVCILGSMFAVSMAIFDMPYIALISVLIAVTAFIPIVGALAGCIIGAVLIMVEDVMLAIWFVAMSLILQQIENNLIYPRVVGSSIGLPGMWVLVAVAFGGELMGVAGMFLMIPIVAVLYVLLREYTNYRLEKRSISADKLEPQPPELVSHLKKKKTKKNSPPKAQTAENALEENGK